MKNKILVVGITGKLGKKLSDLCFKHNIEIYAATCFSNQRSLDKIRSKNNIKYSFVLSDQKQQKSFESFLKKNFSIIYFLDFGSYSLKYLNIILNNNKNSLIAIANKEMIIAGGRLLFKKINQTKNYFIPLDSEHFSLINLNTKNNEIKRIFITASGGPFYFKKKLDLSKVSLNQVLAHPKWNMGINNNIDSSNFINKILEIFELSAIFNIELSKIDFLVSRSAFCHSIIFYNDLNISINCFENDMIIPLIKPLSLKFKNIAFKSKNKISIPDYKRVKMETRNDNRFNLFKHIDGLKTLSHCLQIKFLILNNIAQKRYLNRDIDYIDIIKYIIRNLYDSKFVNTNLNSFDDIIKYTNKIKTFYE